MNKKLTLALSILSFTMLDAIFPIASDDIQRSPKKDPYNCADLIKEFNYFDSLAGNKQELDNTLNALMERKSEIQKPHLNNQIAALICFGANPHWKHRYYTENLLDYGIESDDTQFVSFLLKRNVTILDPSYHIQFKIRSLAMLQQLEPYIDLDRKAPKLKNNIWTIAHQIAQSPSFDADLLKHYIENSDLANNVDDYNELPLHTLASNCNSYDYLMYQSSMRKKAKTLIKKTKNINSFNQKGQTPIDLALQKKNSNVYFNSCKILIDMLKEVGGKATSTNNF